MAAAAAPAFLEPVHLNPSVRIDSRAANMTNDTELACLLRNTMPNTLDTTVRLRGALSGNSTFIITGDIDAMWLRDSMNQILPYLPFAAADASLSAMLVGVRSGRSHPGPYHLTRPPPPYN